MAKQVLIEAKVLCLRCKGIVKITKAKFMPGTHVYNPYYVCHVCCKGK